MTKLITYDPVGWCCEIRGCEHDPAARILITCGGESSLEICHTCLEKLYKELKENFEDDPEM